MNANHSELFEVLITRQSNWPRFVEVYSKTRVISFVASNHEAPFKSCVFNLSEEGSFAKFLADAPNNNRKVLCSSFACLKIKTAREQAIMLILHNMPHAERKGRWIRQIAAMSPRELCKQLEKMPLMSYAELVAMTAEELQDVFPDFETELSSFAQLDQKGA